MINICLCGGQSGCPHHKHCPFPLYNKMAAVSHRWYFAFKLACGHSLSLEDVFTFGKHWDMSIGSVIEEDPHYIAWAMDGVLNFALDSKAFDKWEEASGDVDPLEDVF